MKKFYDIEIDSQIELENGKTLGKLEESKISVNDGNCSSGGWPSDLPKPSVGGYGYTEQGEQTVIVDNESVTTVVNHGVAMGQFATPFDIVDGAYTVIFNGTEYNLNSTLIEETGVYIIGGVTESAYDFSQYPFIIASMNDRTALMTESAGDYEVTVKTETATIHKIDKKYLPEADGLMVEVDQSNTYAQVLEILNKGLMPYMQLGDDYGRARLYVSSVNRHGSRSIEFGSPAVFGYTSGETLNFCVYVDSNGWSNIVASNSVHISYQSYSDGTYVLTRTVTDGVSVYSWESTT